MLSTLNRISSGFLLITVCLAAVAGDTPVGADARYQWRPGSPDGLGKWFEGREIARYMTHEGAPWLERGERDDEERPSTLLAALKLKPGDCVADIGAGSGYLSWRMARAVSPGGRVFAEDIQPEMLAILATNTAARGVTNVVPVLGDPADPHLPPVSVDLAIFVDVYHECDQPYEMIEAVVAALKAGGRLVLVEYRGEDPSVPIKPLHKMTAAQVRREMSVHNLEWIGADERLPRQHVFMFRKSPGNSTAPAPALPR
jgi:precorrin-6B methylase 2